MRDPFNWSLGLGRPLGIQVRVHLILILYVVAEFLRAWLDRGWGPALGLIVLALGVLLVSVLLHEFGHCWAAAAVGGRPSQILLWPLGGLAYVDAPHTAGAQLRVALGGPLVSLGLAVAAAALLWLGPRFPLDLSPVGAHLFVDQGLGTNVLTATFRINEVLLLFNLLPAFPLDGGRVLQCLLWRRHGYRSATLVAVQVGKVAAIGLGLAGLILATQNEMWLLVFVAVFIYIQCEYTLRQVEGGLWLEGPFSLDGGLEADRGAPAEVGHRPGLWRRWLQRRRQRRLERQRQREEADERRVDEILEKLHREGMDRLTEAEKAFLKEASQRLRRRQRSRSP